VEVEIDTETEHLDLYPVGYATPQRMVSRANYTLSITSTLSPEEAAEVNKLIEQGATRYGTAWQVLRNLADALERVNTPETEGRRRDAVGRRERDIDLG